MVCCLFNISAIILVVCFIIKIYTKLTTGWCKSQTSLIGKTVIVTGANTGIGYEASIDFAKRGAKVILACRNRQKAERARFTIINKTGNENIVAKLLDLSSFDSVRAFAEDVADTEDRLDILVNNAAVIADHDGERSQDGHDLLMQVNYYSSFLLTNLLIGLMKKTKKSRIVNVSSIRAKYAHYFDLTKLDTGHTSELRNYSSSKLCNILFTLELAKRLEGTGITTYSLHPGLVASEIFKNVPQSAKILINLLKLVSFKTSEEGAQTIIYCAVAKGIEEYNGEHFEDCWKVSPYSTATVPGLAQKLWELTERGRSVDT